MQHEGAVDGFAFPAALAVGDHRQRPEGAVARLRRGVDQQLAQLDRADRVIQRGQGRQAVGTQVWLLGGQLGQLVGGVRLVQVGQRLRRGEAHQRMVALQALPQRRDGVGADRFEPQGRRDRAGGIEQLVRQGPPIGAAGRHFVQRHQPHHPQVAGQVVLIDRRHVQEHDFLRISPRPGCCYPVRRTAPGSACWPARRSGWRCDTPACRDSTPGRRAGPGHNGRPTRCGPGAAWRPRRRRRSRPGWGRPPWPAHGRTDSRCCGHCGPGSGPSSIHD